MNVSRRDLQNLALPVTAIMALLALWEAAVRLWEVPVFILPPPTLVAVSLANTVLNPLFVKSLLNTLSSMVLGFVTGTAVGVVLAPLIFSSAFCARTLYPIVVGIQTVPKITLAPLILVWFGLGLTSKIILIAIITFFPVLTNMLTGLASVDQKRIDLLRLLGASEWQLLVKLRFPSSLPFLFAALEVTSVYSLIGAIIVEFVGAPGGVGTILLQRNYDLDIAGAFAVISVLSLLGVMLHWAIRVLERKIVFWGGARREKELMPL